MGGTFYSLACKRQEVRQPENPSYHLIFLTYNRCKQWVSLKILTAASSRESKERQNLQVLQNCSQASPSSKHIVQLLDSFVHQGPNGLHQCLVFELLGPNVGQILQWHVDNEDNLEPETILRMSEQFLEAIKFIHDAGMGHGGKVNLYRLFQSFISIYLTSSLCDCTHIATDITENNVAFACSNLSTATKKALFEVLGPPGIEQVTRCDGMPLEESVPKHLVESARWDLGTIG